MLVCESIESIRAHLATVRRKGEVISLVPTMGSLHDGHMKLISQARAKSDLVVCSIFVNPTQFNNQEDFDKYPRNLSMDLNQLEKASCDVVFTPAKSEMYPGKDSLTIDLGPASTILEGKFRPGHFNGVALIVCKLFNIIQPDLAFFGEKDLQQLFLIRKLVRDLDFPIDVVAVPTEREKNGLALSSRNLRLNKEEKENAVILSTSLEIAAKEYKEGKALDEIKREAEERIIASGLQLEYFECVNTDTFEILKYSLSDHKTGIAFCTAAFSGNVRLIDNIVLR